MIFRDFKLRFKCSPRGTRHIECLKGPLGDCNAINFHYSTEKRIKRRLRLTDTVKHNLTCNNWLALSLRYGPDRTHIKRDLVYTQVHKHLTIQESRQSLLSEWIIIPQSRIRICNIDTLFVYTQMVNIWNIIDIYEFAFMG